MGNMKVSQGKCEQCGEDGRNLRLVLKKRVCSRCETIRRAAHNIPGLLVVSVAEAKGHEWLAGLCGMTDIPPANVLDLEGVIAARDNEIDKQKNIVAELVEAVLKSEETVKNQSKSIKALNTVLANAKAANSDITDKYNAISDEVADLLECNKNLNQERLALVAQIEKLTAAATTVKDDLANVEKNLSFAGEIPFDPDNESHLAIVCACEELCTMLIQKNTAYGNSALEPLRMFSKASPREQLLVRIDDKLSRLARGGEFPGDDTIVDLAGYLVLLMAHDRMAV